MIIVGIVSKGLSELVIPNQILGFNVSKIQDYAFDGTGFNVINIQANEVNFGQYAFANMINLHHIYIDDVNSITLQNNVFHNSPELSIYVNAAIAPGHWNINWSGNIANVVWNAKRVYC